MKLKFLLEENGECTAIRERYLGKGGATYLVHIGDKADYEKEYESITVYPRYTSNTPSWKRYQIPYYNMEAMQKDWKI